MSYRVTTIFKPEDKPRVIIYDEKLVAEVPADAISLADLEEAERERALEARRFHDGSAIGLILGSERARKADTSFGNLTHNLPSGSIVYEKLES